MQRRSQRSVMDRRTYSIVRLKGSISLGSMLRVTIRVPGGAVHRGNSVGLIRRASTRFAECHHAIHVYSAGDGRKQYREALFQEIVGVQRLAVHAAAVGSEQIEIGGHDVLGRGP